MKTYRELKLIGSPAKQEELMQRIEQSLRDGWTREAEKEARLKADNKVEHKIFSCSKSGSRPAAALFFTADKNSYLYVANIVPREGRELTVDQYNALLNEFRASFVEPASRESGLDVEIITTSAVRTIDNSMSPEMAQLLKSFSGLANKADGGTHPCDRERFFAFIVRAHKEGALLEETLLKELLAENDWPEESAFDLSCDYRFGIELLGYKLKNP
jgi:hypothetical protein